MEISSHGSRISSISPGDGKSEGLSIRSSAPPRSWTSYSTLGAVARRSNAILALQSLLDDLHVQQSEEAAAKTETERSGRFRFPGQRPVVQPQAFERIAEHRVLLAVDRIEPSEDHRFDGSIARKLLRGGVRCQRDRVADLDVLDDLEAGGDVANFAGAKRCGRVQLGVEVADFEELGLLAVGHQPDAVAGCDASVDDLDIGDDAFVRDRSGSRRSARACGAVRVSARRRHVAHDRFQDLVDAESVFGGCMHDLIVEKPDELSDFRRDLLRDRRWEGRSC